MTVARDLLYGACLAIGVLALVGGVLASSWLLSLAGVVTIVCSIIVLEDRRRG